MRGHSKVKLVITNNLCDQDRTGYQKAHRAFWNERHTVKGRQYRNLRKNSGKHRILPDRPLGQSGSGRDLCHCNYDSSRVMITRDL